MKNEELGGFAAFAPAGVAEIFMTNHKTFRFTCVSRGLRGKAEAINAVLAAIMAKPQFILRS